jgi:hypothetical protein
VADSDPLASERSCNEYAIRCLSVVVPSRLLSADDFPGIFSPMNVILDIGNVICEWSPKKLVAGIFSHEHERQQALDCIIGHNDWLELDKGRIDVNAVELRSGVS